MGYMGLFEGMYKSVIWARDTYLTPSGLMLPSTIDLYLAAAVESAPPPNNLTSRFRKPFFGLDFTALVPVLEGWDAFKMEGGRADWRQGSYPEIAEVRNRNGTGREGGRESFACLLFVPLPA